VAPDLTATSTAPAASASFNNPASVAFSGTIGNTGPGPTAAGQNIWPDLEIDWSQANCAAATSEQVFNAGGPWSAVAAGWNMVVGKTLSAANSELRNGTHCYRFIADRGALVTESNNNNNASAWRSFTVSNLPECSDGIDNTDPEDVLIDYPADPGCIDDADLSESESPDLTSTNLISSLTAAFNTYQSATFSARANNTGNGAATGNIVDRFQFRKSDSVSSTTIYTVTNTGANIAPTTFLTDNSAPTGTFQPLVAGTYYVSHCADVTGVVAESNEGNNCSQMTLTITGGVSATCSPDDTSVYTGEAVTWTGQGSGGFSSSYTYKWGSGPETDSPDVTWGALNANTTQKTCTSPSPGHTGPAECRHQLCDCRIGHVRTNPRCHPLYHHKPAGRNHSAESAHRDRGSH
jgi:hypothetical protein